MKRFYNFNIDKGERQARNKEEDKKGKKNMNNQIMLRGATNPGYTEHIDTRILGMQRVTSN